MTPKGLCRHHFSAQVLASLPSFPKHSPFLWCYLTITSLENLSWPLSQGKASHFRLLQPCIHPYVGPCLITAAVLHLFMRAFLWGAFSMRGGTHIWLCWLLCPQCLAQCLTHSRPSINIYQIDKGWIMSSQPPLGDGRDSEVLGARVSTSSLEDHV